MNLINLTKRLISFKGFSPGCGGAVDFLNSYLNYIGFNSKVYSFDGLKSLFAKTKNSKKIDICFAGHVDVVPPGNLESWKFDPFCGTVDDEILYGRGVVDMKAAICCFVDAANQIKNSSQLNIGIIITSDEESDSRRGMIPLINLLDSNDYKIKRCIVGEPTCKQKIGDTIKIGRRGSINFTVTVNGKQGHVP